MASIILYHSILGLRPAEHRLAQDWRDAGHDVVLPDLFDGWTSESYDDGFKFINDTGLDPAMTRAMAALEPLPEDVVLAGVSMGGAMASRAWQARPKAAGVLFLAGPAPWPTEVAGTPVQLHAARPEPFDDESVFEDWITENPGARLAVYRYDAVGHYFLDPSLPDFNDAADRLCRERCRQFLAGL